MDSDRHPQTGDRRPKTQINGTKRRIKEECEASSSFVWITEGREIENYISTRLQQALSENPSTDISMYEKIPTAKEFERFKADKIAIAHEVADRSNSADLDTLDLTEKVAKLCVKIRSWNAMR